MKYLINILIAGLLLTACTKDSNITLPDQENRLVINSILSPEKPITVLVSSSLISTSTEELKERRDALVTIYKDGISLGQLEYVPADSMMGQFRSYYRLDHYPEPGSTYKVTVEDEGFKTATAETTVPSRASGNIKELIFGGSVGSDRELLSINMEDSDNSLNHYQLVFYRTDSLFKPDGTDTLIIQEDNRSFDFNGTNGDIPSNGIQGLMVYSDVLGWLFDDGLFINNTKNQVLSTRKVINIIGEAKTKVKYRFVLRTVNEDYYKYWKSVELHEKSKNDPISEPVFIYNNVENGFGNVSAYVSHEKSLLVETN